MFASRYPDEGSLSNGAQWDEDCAVFVFELLVKVVLQNRCATQKQTIFLNEIGK